MLLFRAVLQDMYLQLLAQVSLAGWEAAARGWQLSNVGPLSRAEQESCCVCSRGTEGITPCQTPARPLPRTLPPSLAGPSAH